MNVDDDAARLVAAACVAELAWPGPDGLPYAEPATPLLLGKEPALAYPYAREEHARTVAAAALVAVVLSDDRMTSREWSPTLLWARPRLLEDRDGSLFGAELITQELLKYPPSRALIDSPLLRREHWWYLPRLVVAMEVTAVEPVGARPGGHGALLAVAGHGQLSVDTVTVANDAAHPDGTDRLQLTSRTGGVAPDGPAVLLGHDFSPDLETWEPWTVRGRLSWPMLTVAERSERRAADRRPKLWTRLRRQHRLQRACRRALES